MKKLLLFVFTLIFTFTLASCNNTQNEEVKLSISAPGGAPALALASLYYTNSGNYSFELNKSADALKSEFLSNEKDIIVAPINLGATMYKNNGNYKLAASITFGNLYLVTKNSDINLFSDMASKDVTLFGEGTINQYIIEKCLANLNCNKTYLGSTNLTAQAFLSNPNGIYLIAEPAVSNIKSKVKDVKTFSIQDEYQNITGKSYIQAACFIKSITYDEQKYSCDLFLNRLEASINECKNNKALVASYAEELELGATKEVFEAAIPNCGIDFVKGKDNKTLVDTLFENALNFCGGVLPNEGFYI